MDCRISPGGRRRDVDLAQCLDGEPWPANGRRNAAGRRGGQKRIAFARRAIRRRRRRRHARGFGNRAVPLRLGRRGRFLGARHLAERSEREGDGCHDRHRGHDATRTHSIRVYRSPGSLVVRFSRLRSTSFAAQEQVRSKAQVRVQPRAPMRAKQRPPTPEREPRRRSPRRTCSPPHAEGGRSEPPRGTA